MLEHFVPFVLLTCTIAVNCLERINDDDDDDDDLLSLC